MGGRESLASAGYGTVIWRHRYWLFFVIVAVGLALSWGQAGRKAHRVLNEEQLIVLETEPACQPSRVPCAALARDRALVLGPTGSGLALRRTGLAGNQIISAEVVLFTAGDLVLGRRELAGTLDTWWVGDIPPNATMLRVYIQGNHDATLAEFPLSPGD